MIQLKRKEINIQSTFEIDIREKMSELTCKTNLSPQLMFQQSYTGITEKLFVGNWTKNGFWISKFRIQLLDIRPDIIVKFVFLQNKPFTRLCMRYSLGLSSIIQMLLILFMGLILFIQIDKGIILYGMIIMVFFYFLIVRVELNRTERNVQERILDIILKPDK
jgi:hypothetical protein